MYTYIDAILKPRHNCPLAEQAGGFITTDTKGVKTIPAFLFSPAMVMCATSTDIKVFDNEAPELLLADLGEWLESRRGSVLVGWYLDQVIMPMICASSMVDNVKVAPHLMRKLDDKWSKPAGVSMERAFYQGWYSNVKSEDDTMDLTLDRALSLTGFANLADLGENLGTDIPEPQKVLGARLAAISQLHTRYHYLAGGTNGLA